MIFPLDIIRMICAVVFILFLPGFAISLFLLSNKNGISAIDRIVFSFGFSIFYVSVFGSFSLLIVKLLGTSNIVDQMPFFFFSFYVALLLLRIVKIDRFKLKNKLNKISSLKTVKLKISLIILGFLLITSLFVHGGILKGKYLYFGGDVAWHSGATREILDGQFPPNGPYKDMPNAYPWVYHLTLALMSYVFGIDVLASIHSITLVEIFLFILALFVLVRKIFDEKTAIIASYLACFAGGLGWIKFLSEGNGVGDIIVTADIPTQLNKAFGDLVYGWSANSSYYLIQPAVPYDIAFVIFLIANIVLLDYFKKPSLVNLSSLILLSSTMMLTHIKLFIAFFVEISTFMLIRLLYNMRARAHPKSKKNMNFRYLKHFLILLGLSLLLSSLWWVPYLSNLLIAGKWVKTTEKYSLTPPTMKIMPFQYFITAYGVPLILGLYGFLKLIKRKNVLRTEKYALLVSWFVGLLAFSRVFYILIINLPSTSFLEGIFRQSHYFVIFHLALIICASRGLISLATYIGNHKRSITMVCLLLTLTLSAPSTFLMAAAVDGMTENSSFTKNGTPQAMIEIINHTAKKAIIATDPTMTYYVWKFTGKDMVYNIKPREGWDIFSYTGFSQDERYNDTIELLSLNSTLEARIKIVSKYSVKYLILFDMEWVVKDFPGSRVEDLPEPIFSLVYSYQDVDIKHGIKYRVYEVNTSLLYEV